MRRVVVNALVSLVFIAAALTFLVWRRNTVTFASDGESRRAPGYVTDIVREPRGLVVAIQHEPGGNRKDIVQLEDGEMRGRLLARNVLSYALGSGDRHVLWISGEPGDPSSSVFAAPRDGRGEQKKVAWTPSAFALLTDGTEAVYLRDGDRSIVASNVESGAYRVIVDARAHSSAAFASSIVRSRTRYWWETAIGIGVANELWSVPTTGGAPRLELKGSPDDRLELLGTRDDRALFARGRRELAWIEGGAETKVAPLPPECSVRRARSIADDILLQCAHPHPEGGTQATLYRLTLARDAFEVVERDIGSFDADDTTLYFTRRDAIFGRPLKRAR